MSLKQKNRRRNRTTLRWYKLLSRIPLSVKMTAWYSLFLSLMLLLLSFFIIQFTHTWEDSELRKDLQVTVISTAENTKRFRAFHDGIYTILYTPEGLIAKGSVPDGFPADSAQSPMGITEITVQNATYYYYDAPVHSPAFDGWVRGVISINAVSRTTNTMLMALMFGGFLFLIIGSYGGYLLIKRGLRPIRLITHTAAKIGRDKDLSQRITVVARNQDEISYLTKTLNYMLYSLEESSKREKQFSSDVSHELRTPIAVIQAESEFGRQYIDNIEEAKESFDHIFEQSKFMTAMITQLLAIARLDNTENLALTPCNISELVAEVAKAYQPLCENQGIEFISSIPPQLETMAEPILLKRALGNLLDNALKFTNNRISLELVETESRLRIIVGDNGSGLQPKELIHIWDRLYQTESSRNKSNNQGLGLGLSFVSNVMKHHHGQAYAKSIPDVETKFFLELPRL